MRIEKKSSRALKRVMAVVLSLALAMSTVVVAPKTDVAAKKKSKSSAKKKPKLSAKKKTLYYNGKKTFTLKVKKNKVKKIKKTTWKTSNKKVVKISKKKKTSVKLTAKKKGSAKITATVKYTVKGSKKVKKVKLTCKVTSKKKSSGSSTTTNAPASKAPTTTAPAGGGQGGTQSGAPAASQPAASAPAASTEPSAEASEPAASTEPSAEASEPAASVEPSEAAPTEAATTKPTEAATTKPTEAVTVKPTETVAATPTTAVSATPSAAASATPPDEATPTPTVNPASGSATVAISGSAVSGSAASGYSINMAPGDTTGVEAVVIVSGCAVTGSYVWASTDTTVATVAGTEKETTITAVKDGKTTVSVTITTDTGVKATDSVTVNVVTPSVVVTGPAVSTAVSGPAVKLKKGTDVEVSVESIGCEISGTPAWTSDTTSVATVTGSGKNATIHAVEKGTAKVIVKATTASGKELTGTVDVTVGAAGLTEGAATWKFEDAEGYDASKEYSSATVVMNLYADEACTELLTSLAGEDGGTKVCLNDTSNQDAYGGGYGNGVKINEKVSPKYVNKDNLHGLNDEGQITITYDLTAVDSDYTPDCITAQFGGKKTLKGLELVSITFKEKVQPLILAENTDSVTKWTTGATTYKFEDLENYPADNGIDISKYSKITVSMNVFSDQDCTELLTDISEETGGNKICLNDTTDSTLYNGGCGEGIARKYVNAANVSGGNVSFESGKLTVVFTAADWGEKIPDCVTGQYYNNNVIKGMTLDSITFE